MSNELLERNTNIIAIRPKSIRDILEMLAMGKLSLKPFFQRKLVWRKEHKIEFIKTILFNYPFPEIYFSDASNDTNQLNKNKWVIDGQQRINAINEYYLGEGDFKDINIKKFSELTTLEKKNFLDYEVSIRELGEMSDEMLRRIFTRINLTEYSLNPMEKLNATYSTTSLFLFARQCIDENFEFDSYFKDDFKEDELTEEQRTFFLDFFENHSIFTSNDQRRMADLQYMMLLIVTLEKGYSHRTLEVWKAFESDEYNTKKLQQEILPQLESILIFIINLKINYKNLWTTKVNLFTLIIELSRFDNLNKLDLIKVKSLLVSLDEKYLLYKDIKDTEKISTEERIYFNNSLQGVNDKANRLF